MAEIPLDVKACWFNPIRRLQSAAQKSTGLAIVSMKFLVNEVGEPIQWTEPELVLLEPKKSKEAILQLLGK